ncbi:MAG: hypothetical protein E2O82_02680 [Betaproteobacteria bacterium]|nr:MAG: hypothetical protein E2O82_02680 [Betaproteobacteria bacterium]
MKIMKKRLKSQVTTSRKKELYQKSSQYKSAVTSDINRLKFDLERVGKNILYIGGSLYIAYKLTKLMTGSSNDIPKTGDGTQKVIRVRESSPMVLKIKEQITLFLLALAFKKLKEFVTENSSNEDEQEDT